MRRHIDQASKNSGWPDLQIETLPIATISVGRRRLALDDRTVGELAMSVTDVGLLNPIIVQRVGPRSHKLIAGAHRLEAFRRLRRDVIPCRILIKNDKSSRAWAKLAEIDENLIRFELTPAQRAEAITKRKKAYEAAHPEPRHGATGRGRSKIGKVGHSIHRFTADTFSKTGRPERSVRRDVTRAKLLGDDLGRLVGTSLDKGSELDALAAMTPIERGSIIERALAGECISAVTIASTPREGYSRLKRTWPSLKLAWQKASEPGRAQFLEDFETEIRSLLVEIKSLEAR